MIDAGGIRQVSIEIDFVLTCGSGLQSMTISNTPTGTGSLAITSSEVTSSSSCSSSSQPCLRHYKTVSNKHWSLPVRCNNERGIRKFTVRKEKDRAVIAILMYHRKYKKKSTKSDFNCQKNCATAYPIYE